MPARLVRSVPLLFLALLLPLTACDLLYWTEDSAEIPGAEVLYQGSNGDRPNSITALPSGALVVAGFTNARLGPVDQVLSIPLLLRVSPDGHITDTTVYRYVDDGEVTGAVPHRDGLAVFLQEQSYDQETPDLPNATFYHTAPTGERMSTLFQQTDAFLPRRPPHRTSDGGFLLVLSPSGDHPDELVKLNSEGTVAWRNQRSGLRSAVEVAGGDIVVLNRKDSRRYDLTRLSPSGQEQWQRTYGNDTLRRPAAVAPTGDGAAVLGTRSVPNSVEDRIVVTRVDRAGDVLWKRTYARGTVSATAVTALPDGGLAIGYALRERETGPQRSYVVRLAPDGKEQWRRRFGPRAGSPHVNALAVRPDGTIIAAGSTGRQPRWAPSGDLLVVSYDVE